MSVRLTPDESWAFVEHAHTGIFTTLRRDGQPVALPVWFAAVDQKIYVRTPARTKKVARIRSDERCSFLAESGLAWKDLKAVHLSGRAVLVEEGPEYDRAQAAISEKYEGFRTESKDMPDSARKAYSTAWAMIRIDPIGKTLSWDNAKLRQPGD